MDDVVNTKLHRTYFRLKGIAIYNNIIIVVGIENRNETQDLKKRG